MHTALAEAQRNSIFVTQEELAAPDHMDKWEAAGKPFEWLQVETAKGYTAWLDVGYGHVALTKGKELVGIGKFSVTGTLHHQGVVMLDKNYYGIENYLFFVP